MRKVKFYFLILAVLMTAGFQTKAQGVTTVVDIIVNSPDHNTLETAVIAAGLVPTLQGPGPFTVFAPTDAAFAALPDGTLAALLADIPALTDILLYHVVGAKAMSSDLSFGQSIETLLGKNVNVVILNGNVYINNALVTVADLEADNGVVHVIDAVLLPPASLPATVVDIIGSSPVHRNLDFALSAAGLDDDLQGAGPFTVFAPTDAAFEALPAGMVEELFANPQELANILLYHSVGAKALSSSLNDGQKVRTLFGKDVTVTINSGGVFINNAKVTIADLEAENGVVHVIDAVLVPSADVKIAETASKGKVITDSNGRTLYFLTRDAKGMSMCTGGCLNNWPIFYAENILAGAGLNPTDFSTIDRGSGVMQTTYKGWPLYYYVNDSEPGNMNGEGLSGRWFVAKPDYSIMIVDNQLTGLNGVNYKGDYTPGDEVIQYFTDDRGLTLYTWKNDQYNVNKFTRPDFSNNGAWPIYEETEIIIPSVLNGTDFGVINVHGRNQLTYKGWPLYYFGQDMMVRGNNKGVSVPVPGTWPVPVKDMKSPKYSTVVDIIVASPDHNILETAVIEAGLVETLQGEGPFTVFAPTDAAFAALPEGTLDALIADIPALTNILLYHVVGAKAMSSDLSNGQKIVTVQGQEVTVIINNDGVFINNAKVTVADLEAVNGVVHVIDAVLMPLPATVVDIILNSPDHNTLEAAVIAAGLVETLQGEGPFTVFAPTDAAFEALPEGTLEALLEDIPALTNILLYHVVGAKAMSSDLSNGQKIVTVQGKEVIVTINDEGVFINNAKVTVVDLEAENGVVHVIDAVLIPSTMPASVVDIIVNSPDHNTLETAVIAAGLVETLQGEGPFTVFAPTDAAFAALPIGTINELLDDPTGALTDILLYHVVGAKAMSSDLSDGQTITTVLGKDFTVTINSDGVFINNAKVTVVDLEADNGVVHVIDAVLIPVDKAAFPIDFETKTDAVWEVFANGAGADDDFMVIVNPDLTGINTSDNVLKFKVNDGADPWAGAFSNSYAPVEFTEEMNKVTMMVWKSVISPVGFKVEASSNGGPVTEVKVANTVTNQWEKLTFDMSALVGYSYDRIVIFPDFPNTRTSGTTVYVDNIQIEKKTTVVDIIVNSPDHNTLEAAVIAAGLVETLQGEGPFTVFAPTDAAFAALPEGTIEALLGDIPALTDILLYHVVGAKAMSSDLSNGQKIVTVQGKEVTVTINEEGVFINNAKVTVADLEADNGVVHVIDAVLLPPVLPATVVDIIINSDAHNTLEAAVIAAGLVETLQGEGPFTVFAPTDSAFAALPAGTIEALLGDIPALTNILLYHVVGAKAMSSDLSNGQKIVTAQGKEVTVTINADGVFINNAKVTVADLEAENGVVHVIDAVLLPPVDKAAFPIDFETMTDAVWEVFANGAGSDDDFMVIANPDKTGINTSDNVLKFKVNDGADPWAGAFSDSYAPVEFTENSHIVTMMVWKSVISPVGFKVEASTNGGPVTEVKVSNTLTNQWEKLTFDLSALIGYSYNRIVIFPDFPATRTSGTTVYVDNVEIEKTLPATVVDIIVNSDAHNTLEAAVIAAGLVETLQGDGPFTVFAPTDAAFAALPEGTIEALLGDIPALTDILLYHVVGAKAMSSDLSNGQKIVTVQGKEVTVTINADGVFINNAKVTVADLEAENGVVHVIDAVLLPPVDKAAFPIDFETMTDAVWNVFANGAGADDDFMVIANPDKTGINTSDNVLKFKVNDGADPWAGAFSDSYAPVEFTEQSHIVTMMVWKSVISPVAFKVEASTNGGPVTEVKVSNTVVNQWEKLTFDMSALVGYSYDRIVIFPDFPATRTSGTTVYIDNIAIEKTLPATVVDIIVNSPDHNTLEAAVIAAGLVETLQGDGPFTVFAPTDAAFAALPAGTLEALLGDIPALTNILLYHVVGAKAMSSDLSNGQKIVTVQGESVTVTINDDGVFINNAKVTVADLEADNGVVHVIDVVLDPTNTSISTLDDVTFEIYPNPATDYIRINSNVGIERLIIRDIAGRVVTQMNNISSSERIELNGFKSGMYLVTMKNGNSVSTKKLIVR